MPVNKEKDKEYVLKATREKGIKAPSVCGLPISWTVQGSVSAGALACWFLCADNGYFNTATTTGAGHTKGNGLTHNTLSDRSDH
jgi:hypothetical protein